ncbi:MAG: hypothetical protein WBO35_02630, partial [Candidatus Saccharimonadales bacterium]
VMGGAFISSWLRMVFAAAASAGPIDRGDWILPSANNTCGCINGGRGNTVAAAKRESLKAKRRKAHRRRVR